MNDNVIFLRIDWSVGGAFIHFELSAAWVTMAMYPSQKRNQPCITENLELTPKLTLKPHILLQWTGLGSGLVRMFLVHNSAQIIFISNYIFFSKSVHIGNYFWQPVSKQSLLLLFMATVPCMCKRLEELRDTEGWTQFNDLFQIKKLMDGREGTLNKSNAKDWSSSKNTKRKGWNTGRWSIMFVCLFVRLYLGVHCICLQ